MKLRRNNDKWKLNGDEGLHPDEIHVKLYNLLFIQLYREFDEGLDDRIYGQLDWQLDVQLYWGLEENLYETK